MIKLNSNEKLVKQIREALKQNDGYCPCQLLKTPETRCICQEFLIQEEGQCHCGLYLKIKD